MIVSSEISQQNVQTDGRCEVREVWTDDQGNQYVYDYMANAGTDINAVMNARQPQVLADAEAHQALLAMEN